MKDNRTDTMKGEESAIVNEENKTNEEKRNDKKELFDKIMQEYIDADELLRQSVNIKTTQKQTSIKECMQLGYDPDYDSDASSRTEYEHNDFDIIDEQKKQNERRKILNKLEDELNNELNNSL